MKPKYIHIEIYSKDSDNIPEDYPFLKDGRLDLYIDIDTKQILNTPKQENLELGGLNLFEKVVDTGSYYLLDEHKNTIASIREDYVPNCIPNEYGDYVDLEVNENGIVTNWLSSKEEIIEEFKDKNE